MAQKEERTDRACHDRGCGNRMARYLSTQATILVIGFIGEIFGSVAKATSVCAALMPEAPACVTPAFDQVVRTVRSVARVLADAIADALTDTVDPVLDVI